MSKNRKTKKQTKIPKQIFGVKNSKVANRLKRVFPKFRDDRSEVRGVNGRSKFVAASAGRAERKQFLNFLNIESIEHIEHNPYRSKAAQIINILKQVRPPYAVCIHPAGIARKLLVRKLDPKIPNFLKKI